MEVADILYSWYTTNNNYGGRDQGREWGFAERGRECRGQWRQRGVVAREI